MKHAFVGLIILSQLMAAGCAARGKAPVQHQVSMRTVSTTERLPLVERGAITADLAMLAGLKPAPPVFGVEDYRGLTPTEAQCGAASASTIGNLVSSERRAIAAAAAERHHGADEATRLQLHLLSFVAVEARNQSAADALQAYYNLALAEHGRDTIEHLLAEQNRARDLGEQARTRGVQISTDLTELDRQLLDTQQQLAELEINTGELNAALRELLAISPREGYWKFWPETPLTVQPQAIDSNLAVATALENRPELGLLRVLIANLNEETLPVARAAVGRADSLLGASASAAKPCFPCLAALLLAHSADAEVEARRAQLCDYLGRREAAVAAEVQRAITKLDVRLDQVLLARSTVSSWERRLELVRQQQQTGNATFLDISLAEQRLLEARQQVIQRTVEWHLAMVELKDAQGILAGECGYYPSYECRLTGFVR